MSKLLSYGGFGCVFYPAFNCSGKLLNDKYINKVQKYNFNSINEIYISFFIKQIDNYDKYFIPILSSCNLNLRKIDKNYIKDCKLIKNTKFNKYISLKIKYFNSYKFLDIYNNLNNKNSHTKLNIFIFNTYRLLLEALNKLNSINIIHFDLKSDNILFDKNTFYPKIIDFGISIPLNKLNKNNLKNYFYVFAPEYYIWCLDIHFINFLLYEKNTIDIDDIKIITNNYYDNNYFNKFSNTNIKLLTNNSINFFSKYINKNNDFIINDLLKYSYSWDNYSLSILLLTIINEKQSTFFNLLFNNINSNPDYRLTLNKTYDTFNNIISNLDFNNIFDVNNSELLNIYSNTIVNSDKLTNKID